MIESGVSRMAMAVTLALAGVCIGLVSNARFMPHPQQVRVWLDDQIGGGGGGGGPCLNETALGILASAGLTTACPQELPDDCFDVQHGCDTIRNCLVIRPLCRTGEFYPVLTIDQGGRSVSLLGKPYPHDYSHAFKLDYSSARGLEFGATANMAIATYFHCAVNLYGRDTFFIGLTNNDTSSALELNRVVYTQTGIRLRGPKPKARACPGGGGRPLQPLAVNNASCNLAAADDGDQGDVDDDTDRVPLYDQHHAAGRHPANVLVGNDEPTTKTTTTTTWMHLVGDSNMRKLFMKFCQLCGSSLDLVPQLHATCRCAHPSGLYVHYSLAWLGYTPVFNHTGATLSALIDPAYESAVPHADRKAAVTLVSLGSHSAHVPISELRALVPEFIDTMRNATNGGALALALTTAVCIEKVPSKYEHTRGTWEILQRNNYRVLALNEIIVEEAARRRIPVFDLFAWSLSVGCDNFVDAVHMNDHVYAQFASAVARAWMPGAWLGV